MRLLNNRNLGYSLIEMSVVLVLISIVCVFSISIGFYFHRLLVRTDIEKLYMCLKYLQQSAKATHNQQELVFDVFQNKYSFKKTDNILSSSTQFGILPEIKGPPSDPKNIITKAITFNNNRIRFHPDGTIDSGTIYCIDKKNNTLYALTCAIGGSSYIRTYRYDNGWHLLNIE